MRRLALFARPPEIGRVKPRLSPALPAAAAAALYGGMLEDAIEAMRAATAADERFIYWAGAEATLFTPGVADGTPAAGDLGERLGSGFESMLTARGDRAVIFGSDCPALDAAVIDAAFARLESADLVLAPSRSGGLALLGLARAVPEMFHGVAWSPERVLAQTIARGEEMGLRVAGLDRLDDVEVPEDLCRLVASAVTPGAKLGANTRAALVKLGLLPAP